MRRGPVTVRCSAIFAIRARDLPVRAQNYPLLSSSPFIKWSGRVLRAIAWLLLSLVVAGMLGVFALRLPSVQTWLAGRISAYATEALGSCVQVDRVHLTFTGPAELRGVLVCDLKGDTLFAVRRLNLRRWRVSTERRQVHLRGVVVEGVRWHLRQGVDDPTSNFTQWIAALSSGDTTAPGAPWAIQADAFTIRDLRFTHHKDTSPVRPFGVDFDHVDVSGDVLGHDLLVIEDSIQAVLDHISFREKSGLVCTGLQGRATVSGRGIAVEYLELRTPFSTLRGRYEMRSASWKDYTGYIDRVEMLAELDSSVVDLRDIAWFAPDLEGLAARVGVRGRARGTVRELKARDLTLDYGRHTHFEGSVEMSGLPDLAGTFVVVDARTLRTDAADLATVPVPPFPEGRVLEVPRELAVLGPMAFRGNFTGFASAFTAYGSATTQLGALSTDLSYERDTVSDVFRFNGALATTGFDLAPLAGDPTVGPIAFDVKVNAKGRDLATMQADLDGRVPLITINDRPLTGITASGRLQRRLFNGRLTCDDPSVKLSFDGLADLRGKWPKVDFTADLERADLFELNIAPELHLGEVSGIVRAQGELAPDSLKGRLAIEGLTYCDDQGVLELGDVELASARRDGEPMLSLRSGLVNADVQGRFLPTRLPDAFLSVVYSVFPALSDRARYDQEEQRFAFDVHVKEAGPLLRRLVPRLELDPGAHFSGMFDTRTFDMALSADLPRIAYGTVGGDSVRVILDKTLDLLIFSMRSERQQLTDSTFLEGIDLSGKAYQDELEVRMVWDGSTHDTRGDLRLAGLVNGWTDVELDLLPSRLHLGLGAWSNPEPVRLHYHEGGLEVRQLEVLNEDERITLDGWLAADPERALAFDVDGVRLRHLRPFYKGPMVSGSLSGEGRVFDLLGEPSLISHLCVDSLKVDKHPVGDITFAATWRDSRREMEVGGTLQRGRLKALEFSGRIAPAAEAEQLDLVLDLDSFDLAFIDPYLPAGVSDIQGRVTGDIRVGGTFAEPRVEGTAVLDEAGLRIDYLNTFYSLSDRVRILPDGFWLDLVRVKDQEGRTARAVGTINHKGFTNWDYDVVLELDRFLCLNTTVNDNELFYGKAYGTGDLQVSGYQDNLEVVFTGRTAPGTTISLPLGTARDLSGIDFVRFHAGRLELDTARAPVDLSGVRLDLDVEVTPDARFELIFDPTVGDILSGRGRGNIEMTVSPTGNLSMRGDMEVVDGTYLFTLRNVVNKRFDVDPGGHITWYGDPFDAQLALNAVYKLRAPLVDIIPAERAEGLGKRVPVEVVMRLKDRLANPDIGFDVRLPSVDEGTRTQVNSVLSEPDEMNRQVFSLIVLNRFLPVDRLGAANGPAGSRGNVVGTSGSELLSNQVSNWLSRLSNDVDLGFNYRPGDALTQDELELAVSTQLFNERLVLSTNLGVQYGSSASQQNNALVGDFQLEYLMTNDGRIRLKAFSQSNDRNLNQADQAATTQGAGVAYREDFDTLGELWRNFTVMLGFRRRPPGVTPTTPVPEEGAEPR
ncbi:MAG: translocation/assembly module TamB domain-containing protein [Flavobacteriales bacterium]|nr:translocation/assembly module TamB domain-containing protein [Flavobacteriales bacterium]